MKMQLAKKSIKLEGDEIAQYITDPHWAFDRKLDGTRVVAEKLNGFVKLWGRGSRLTEFGREQTLYNDQFPEIVKALQDIELDNFVFDGELVVMHDGVEDFNLLQKRTTRKKDITEYSERYPATYFVFDLIYDVSGNYHSNLRGRRTMLEILFSQFADEHISLLPIYHVWEDKKDLVDAVINKGLEGVMMKELDAKYVEGKSNHWIKAKRTFTEDVFVMGYSKGTGRREKWFGALHCYKMVDGYPVWVTDVGGGFNDEMLDYFTRTQSEQPGFSRDSGVLYYHSLQSIEVIEIEHYGIMKNGRRHPQFVRLRLDKDPEDCNGVVG